MSRRLDVEPMTDAELRAIHERCHAASPGPWRPCGAKDPCSCGLIWSLPSDAVVAAGRGCDNDEMKEGFTTEQRGRNERFIAATRTDVPRLITEIYRLREALHAATPRGESVK